MEEVDFSKYPSVTLEFLLLGFASISRFPLAELSRKSTLVQLNPPLIKFGKAIFHFHFVEANGRLEIAGIGSTNQESNSLT